MQLSGSWRATTIAGKTVEIFEPDTPCEPPAAVVFLHGHGKERLSQNAIFTEQFAKAGLRVVCPEGKRSWWLDCLSPEFDADVTPLDFLRESVIEFIEQEWQIEPPMIGLAGVSMGGQGVLQWAYRDAMRFPIVAAISPAIDFHRCWGQGLPLDEMFPSTEEARQETVILKIHPLNWPRHQLLLCDRTDEFWFEGVDRLTLKLHSSGIPFETDFETGVGGHSWKYFNHVAPKVVAFLADRLEKESRALR